MRVSNKGNGHLAIPVALVSNARNPWYLLPQSALVDKTLRSGMSRWSSAGCDTDGNPL